MQKRNNEGTRNNDNHFKQDRPTYRSQMSGSKHGERLVAMMEEYANNIVNEQATYPPQGYKKISKAHIEASVGNLKQIADKLHRIIKTEDKNLDYLVRNSVGHIDSISNFYNHDMQTTYNAIRLLKKSKEAINDPVMNNKRHITEIREYFDQLSRHLNGALD